jgi:hypothetical protein
LAYLIFVYKNYTTITQTQSIFYTANLWISHIKKLKIKKGLPAFETAPSVMKNFRLPVNPGNPKNPGSDYLT